MNETLLRRESGGVLWLALNRPEKINAFNDEMTAALIEALDGASGSDAVRVVVIGGGGRGFSSGQDLEAFVRLQSSAESVSIAEHLRRGYNVVTTKLREIEKPAIAMMSGISAGVGLSIALACDLRIAAEDATFTLGFSRIGLIPDGGASLLLPALVGLPRALELAWTSDRIGAAEAHRIGLVNRVVAPAELERATAALADQLAQMPRSALALTKRAMNRAMLPELGAWLESEALLQEEAASYADHAEGVRAFMEKRAPHFAGATERSHA